MRNRIVRLCVVAALVASAAGAAVIIRSELTPAAPRHPEGFDRRVDRLHALVIEVMRVESAYVAPGQNPAPALVRFPEAFNEISILTGELSALRRSPAAIREVRAFVEATSTLAQADADAREHLLLGDVQSASHVIFGKAGAATVEMTAALGRLRDLEHAEVQGESVTLSERTEIAAASIAALWVIALFVFAFVPAKARTAALRTGTRDSGLGARKAPEESRSDSGLEALGATQVPAYSNATALSIDLDAAADLCTEIGRVESPGALTGLLTRAVTLLDADGIIVWLESSGQLFAAAAAGYPPDTLARLRPIASDDAHAVAAAWREATTETVDATSEGDGAVVVPLFSGASCFGVFTVELKPGREQDAVTRAVARLLAAQLAVVVGGSPGSSSAAIATGT